MSFLRDSEGFMSKRETADFYNAEMLSVYWETKPEIIEKLLPPPLKPAKIPVAYAFVATYPKTNFGVSYNEAALFLSCQFEDNNSNLLEGYCLAMPVTNDMALVAGREVFGYPKKLADVHFNREKRFAEGWVERHGTRFFEVKAKLNGRPNSSDFIELFTERTGGGVGNEFPIVCYNYKHFPSPDGASFDYKPRLIKEEVLFKPEELKLGNAEIILKSSDNDPWAEIEVERILGALYLKGNNSMLKGFVVAELEPEKFIPYSFLKWDIEM
jgi:acetoacetate decarboxylase